MAGTIVSDVLQDGAGNSTATTNAISGSAKAWVNFNGVTSITVRASYNVSSVVRNSTGYYTINMTNAMSDANYNVIASIGSGNPTPIVLINSSSYNTPVTPTTSSFSLCALNSATGSASDIQYVSVLVNR
jgi:hypothetical protein